MKRRKKISENTCALFEEFLIKKDLNMLGDADLEILKEHLKECTNCIHYDQSLNIIKSQIKVKPDFKLIPNPQIKHNLIQYFKNSYESKKAGRLGLWEDIKKLCSYRIPVYQAAIGAILVIIFVFSFREFSLSTKYNQTISGQSQILLDTLFNKQLNVIDDIRILDQQKIGRTVIEDSVLTSLIFKSL
jgi:hypothetical protein